MYDPYAELVYNKLPNGLGVHSVFWERPWLVFGVVVHSGAREDPKSRPGLAHFVEHCVSRNHPTLSYTKAKQFFESSGGDADFGCTSALSTDYDFFTPAKPEVFREALGIFGHMLLGARLHKEIEEQRSVIEREFNQRYKFQKEFDWSMAPQRALFRGHWLETYSRPLGTLDGFLGAGATDLQGYYDEHYTPQNMDVVVVGGLAEDLVLSELLASPFGQKISGRRNPMLPPFEGLQPPVTQNQTVRLSDFISLKIDQVGYRAVWPFPVTFPRQARRMFMNMLYDILFDEIRRKRSLAYSVNTNHQYYQDTSLVEVACQIDPKSVDYIGDLVTTCIKTLPSRIDLFDHNLGQALNTCQMIDLNGHRLREISMNDLSDHHRVITLQEEHNNLQKVTLEQMAEAASFLSSDRQFTFITRP